MLHSSLYSSLLIRLLITSSVQVPFYQRNIERFGEGAGRQVLRN